MVILPPMPSPALTKDDVTKWLTSAHSSLAAIACESMAHSMRSGRDAAAYSDDRSHMSSANAFSGLALVAEKKKPWLDQSTRPCSVACVHHVLHVIC